ncbi:hypothetical protein [Streptomyces chiangmaiensis]|uniref:Uncharacterized protein n=1 Tax=Streptomyces chiangmaiensis TaxID=766497 RepID=A0ABU7FRV6_9ACTN|nr:hypothetical protein [Streptomyces chiangmaiensis]MED7826708.1 hypothetical protein [Streptomyces chiangmaiensis]
MADVELPKGLVALQLDVYAARLRLVEHVRANGPVRDWSPEADAEGADLQHACEVSEAVLQKAIDESGLEQKHGRRALCRALMAGAARSWQASPEPRRTTRECLSA